MIKKLALRPVQPYDCDLPTIHHASLNCKLSCVALEV